MISKFARAMGVAFLLAWIGTACQSIPQEPPPNTQATIQAAVGTQLAQYTPAVDYQATITAQANQIASQSTAIAALQATPDTQEAIRQALLARLGWPADQLSFDIAEIRGEYAVGSLSRVGEMGGAAWFAVHSNGQWVILHIGQGVPYCEELEPFNPPTDWISHCVDVTGNTVQR
ncbi:MAG: hypothetical protein GXO56_00195 [Chloroflexi bacterium]|nr:hypothetical protein [Chloroflexota bacterium]